MRSVQYWKEKFRWHYKNRLKKLKLALKYFRPCPIYIVSKQARKTRCLPTQDKTLTGAYGRKERNLAIKYHINYSMEAVT